MGAAKDHSPNVDDNNTVSLATLLFVKLSPKSRFLGG